MNFNRRFFLKTSSLAACAGTLGTVASWAVARPAWLRVLKTALPPDPAEQEVLAFVARYASEVRLVGAGVLASVRGARVHSVHLLVRIASPEALASVLAGGIPFAGAYSEENTIFFTHGGIEFSVENLLAADFTKQLAALAIKKNVAFAHDALHYNPATRELGDPFVAAASPVVKVVNPTIVGPAALDIVLRGLVEARQLGLGITGTFAAFQRRTLLLIARAGTANATSEALLRRIATLSQDLPPESVAGVLRSRTVSTALKQTFGTDAVRVVAQFNAQRPAVGGDVSNAALWLALLIGPEIESESADGAATTWLQRGTRFDVLRSRAALAGARRLVAPDR